MYTGLRTYYESLGYVVDNIGTTITTSMLNNYSYIFVGDGGNDWLESEIIAAETYIQNGGIFIGIGVTSPANGTAELATNHGINFLGYAVGSSGSTTNIDSYHPLLEGVTWIYIPGVYNSLDVTNSAKPILWDTTGSGIYGATVDIGFGRLLVLAGDFSYYLYSYDNEILFFNILKWLYWQPQEHEISVSLSTPSALLPGNTTSINVTVENRGLNNETDVVLQLWINGTLETTQNYPSFLTGTTETLSFTWTPTEVGSYNVTAYLFPVTNETSLENNIDTNTVIVTEPILNFEIGDYIHLLDLYGREWTFNYTGYIDETHVRIEMTVNETSGLDPIFEWMSVNTLTGLIEDGNSSYIGYDYFGQIRTDIGVGDTVNWIEYSGTVVGTVFYEWNGTFLEAWNISFTSMGVYTYYHKETGVWLLYYNPSIPGGIYMVDTSMIVWQLPEHELRVELGINISVQPGDTALINATVYNSGIEDETNIELILYLDEVPVSTSGIISTLLAGNNFSIQFTWNVVDYGTYNFTAYSSPVINETNPLNNIAVIMYEVIDPTMRMGFISTYGESSLPNLMTYYDGLGYVVDIINSEITFDVLRRYQYIFVGEYGANWTTSEIAALEDYIINGGIFIGIGDSPASSCTVEIAANYGITFLGNSIGSSGSSTNIDHFHPLMENVTSIYIPGIYDALEVSGFAEPILWDSTGLGLYGAAVNIGDGHLLVLADDFDYTILDADNEQLFLNILGWPSWEPPAHDLAVILDVPTDLRLAGAVTINNTFINRGLNNETSVELQIWINNIMVTTQTYPSVQTGATVTFGYQWTPSDYGVYNITAYILPVINETLIRNNNMTIMTNVVRFFPSAPIYISSNAQLSSLFPGTGTVDDPVRIEWYNITASSGTLIDIRYTTLHFRITNCSLNGMSTSMHGIFLYNVIHGTIENNTIYNNRYCGIKIDYSSNNTLTNNNIHDNLQESGIWLLHSNHNIISENTVFNNDDDGIRLLLSSSNNTVSNNICYNNNWVGIRLQTSVHNNTITYNTVYTNKEWGILIEGSPDPSSHNIVTYNIVHTNLNGGIGLWGSEYTTISSNTVYDNGEHGISVGESNENIITNNRVYNSANVGIWTGWSENNLISNNDVQTSSGWGSISTLYATGISIINNSVHGNFNNGIFIESSNNSLVDYNNVFNNFRNGIVVVHSPNIIVTNNIVKNNEAVGIRVDNSGDNILDQNLIDNNQAQGIWVGNSDNIRIAGNTVVYSQGDSGINLFECTNSIITNNDISNNQIGILLEKSQNTVISYNIIENNANYGINISNWNEGILEESVDNAATFNDLIGNNLGQVQILTLMVL
jgi:parallel beta-helix repeat protein